MWRYGKIRSRPGRRAHFEKPILVGRRVLGEMAVVSEPAAIRRVLLDNVTNYRKDDLQRRVLSPGLGDGLLTAEGKQWRAQRRTVAPMFTPRTVLSFAPQMDEPRACKRAASTAP